MAIKLENPEKYLCKDTKSNLDGVIKNKLGKKFDFVLVIVAAKTGVGMGKSVLFMASCSYVDPDNFSIERVLFDGTDYKMIEKKLKELQAFGFDEPDAFFSTEAMTREQRKLKLKFSKIRQKRHFIVICSPSLLLLSKWFRGTGQSRVDCVWHIVRRGIFYSYGNKSGALNRIKIDTKNNKIIWPACDFIGFFKKIPEKSDFWKAYLRKKNAFLKQADENPRAIALMKRERLKMHNSLTLRNIAEIKKVHVRTVRGWVKDGWFGRHGTFVGLDGAIRVKMKAYNAGIRRLEKYKNTGRLPRLIIEARNRMKAKKKRKR